ncbi:MAG: tyrosine-type recombinase/integrase [Pirellulaceae bacterium]|nr:tyrosine-type recombinase/integrase [Pirellulaceae bacterium]
MIDPENDHIRIGDFVTIRPRGKKRTWTAEIWQNGQHRRQSLRTCNVKIAKERARRLDLEIAEGIYPGRQQKPVVISLTAAVEEYETFLKSEGRRRKTLTKYSGILRRKLGPFAAAQGIENLRDVSLRLIDQYRAEQAAKLSERSMHNEGVALKTFLGWCAERKLIDQNPLDSRKFRRPRQKSLGGPTLDQINQLLKGSASIRVPVLATLAFTGMRASECCHLTPGDVDFKGGWIYIVSRPGFETKTGQSWKVPIHPRLRQILQGMPKGQRAWFFTALPSPKYPAGGRHLNMKHVCEDLKRVLAKLGIAVGKKNGGYTLHSLRASFKTIAINVGIPREVVDDWQNHAGRRPTASDAYYRLSDEESQRFMLRMPFDEPQQPDDGKTNGGGECERS